MPNSNSPRVIGRFAPSPTGALHLGSLVTAVASYCLVKREQGQWLLRIEDTDIQRCHSHYSEQILQDLDRLGLHWDGNVRYQSRNLDIYNSFLEKDLFNLSYGCDCSRKFIKAYNQAHHLANLRYPQLCHVKHLDRCHAVRLIMPDQQVIFYDQLQGIIAGNPQLDHGDIIVRRSSQTLHKLDGVINYMLAVVIDDALQGVNQVVRGLDILPLTIPQLVIADYLKLPLINHYFHLPILVNEQGQKLSKQVLAEPIQPYSAQQLLKLALKLLRQPDVALDKPTTMLQQAVAQWTSTPLTQQKQIYCPPLATLLA